MNLFLICILFGLHTSVKNVELLLILTPAKNPDVATLGTNQFTLSCSYRTDSSDILVALELYRKRASESVENKIVSFPATGGNKNASYLDATLKTRTSTDWPSAGNQANLVFSSIVCDDKALYIWKATYITSQSEIALANTSISVLVKAITTFNHTAGQITYSPSIDLAEGDEVAFTCSGDVGNEPVGYLGWYYYLKSDPTVPVNASSRAEATTPVYQSLTCSYTRSSTLKLTLTKEFNQFLVRCTVQQFRYDQFGQGYRQTPEINVFYAPRIDPLNSVPEKTEGGSVTLNCNADANPPPTYNWLLPNSETRPGSQLQLANLTVNDTGVYTCMVYNSYRNVEHTSSTSTRINVRNKTGQSSNEDQDAKASHSSVATIVGSIVGSLAVVLTAVVLFIIYHRWQKLKAKITDGDSACVGTTRSRGDSNEPENKGTNHSYNTLENRETEHSYSVIESRGKGGIYNTLESSVMEHTYNTLEGNTAIHINNTLESLGNDHTSIVLKS